MLSVAPSVISLDPHPCWPSITSSQRDAGLVLVLVGMPGSSCSYSSSDPSSLLESDWPDSPESPESTDAKRLNAVCFFWTCGEQGIFRFGWPRCPEDASWPVHSRCRCSFPTSRKLCCRFAWAANASCIITPKDYMQAAIINRGPGPIIKQQCSMRLDRGFHNHDGIADKLSWWLCCLVLL
jgi:hypothetical protein